MVSKLKKKNPIKLLWVGDSVVASGFSRVTHGILDNLPEGEYDIDVLGINYNGDPHEHDYRIWPAKQGGDMMGFGKINNLVNHIKPDLVVLFNDLWVVAKYHELIKDYEGKIATYFPVDSRGYNLEWVKPLNNFDRVMVYTDFAEGTLREMGFEKHVDIIPHGVNLDKFFPTSQSDSRKKLSGMDDDMFVVFNGNRNQPRKRIDLTVKGFCQFAQDKPDARLYLHMGLLDSGWDLLSLMRRECKKYGLDIAERLIITNPKLSPGNAVTIEHLNVIYNSADVGVNTSLGEGFGLVNFEQAACKVPQIVTNYSANPELYTGRGQLLPIRQHLTQTQINTEGGLVHEDDLAEALDTYYNDRELMAKHAEAMYNFVLQPQFSWKEISKRFDKIFKELIG